MRKPKAFLQRRNKDWSYAFVYLAIEGLIERGYEIHPFEEEDLQGTLIGKHIDIDTDIIIGTVDAVTLFLKENDIAIPEPLGYPDSLKPFLGREIVETTFGLAGTDFPYFMKPSGQVKLFTGDVFSHEGDFEMATRYGAVADTPVFKSELMDFESEYRCFVTTIDSPLSMHGKLKAMKHYKGDFTIFPNMGRVWEMIEAYDTAPSAYTLDVGVTADGDTYLVEVNDMWAIDSYGLDYKEYALLCDRRFREIVRKGKVNEEKVC